MTGSRARVIGTIFRREIATIRRTPGYWLLSFGLLVVLAAVLTVGGGGETGFVPAIVDLLLPTEVLVPLVAVVLGYRALLADGDELATALSWLDQGRQVARATVISTWGSSPRPVGSQMVVDADNNMVGSVSGGCIEGAVVHEGKQAMQSGKPKTLEFGVSDEQAWEVGLACGGTVHVYVEPLE